MDFSLFKRSGLKLLPVLLTLTASPNLLRAANLLTASPTAPTLTCSTSSGTTPVTVTLTPGSSSASLTTVTFAALTGGVTVTPASQTIAANSKTAVTFSVSLAPGCVSVTNAATPTVQFKVNGTNDATITVTTNLAAGTVNPLSAAPNPVSVTCVYNPASGGSWTPGPAVTVSVTSAATGGTPVTVSTSNAWLNPSAVTGSPATSTAATFTVQAVSPCNSATTGTVSGAVSLGAGGVAVAKSLTVNTVIVPPTPLSISPAAPSLTYVKASGAAGYVDVSISATVPTSTYFFAINTATMPSWLTASVLNGTTTKSVRFSSTNVADTLAPGTYSASVHVTVSGTGDLTIPITMLLTNSAPKLTATVSPGNTINWQIGQPLPTPTITAFSSDTPIPFTVTYGGPLGPTVPASELSGLAYSFGTPVNVSFSSQVFAAAVPNQVLTGTVTLTYGSPAATIVETFNVNVLSPSASMTALSPASLPTANASPVTTFTVTLTGSGFITGTDPTKRTTVGIVAQGASNNALTLDSAFSANVVNSSNIILTITVPSTADSLLPFSTSGAGGPVTIGVCNPVNGAACTTATGTQTLTIGSGPIIQAITSSSSLIQVSAPAMPSVAPYDMISIFGSNFCSQGGTGCSTSQILYGALDPTGSFYLTALTPDSGASPRNLSVTFYQHGTATSLGNAPLLFATNGQINALVPSGVISKIGSPIDVVVNFGTKSSSAYVVNCVATDPGLFTIGADGQGVTAALDANYNLIGQSNPAGMRHTSPSDQVAIYMTGLGAPETGADDTATGGSTWPTDCASVSSFLTELTSVTGNVLTTLDGALVTPTAINTGRFAPCVGGAGSFLPSVTVGGVSASSVAFAGWVAGTVAGLYQLNVVLPQSNGGPFTDINGNSISEANLATARALPVVVTSNSVASQTGVTLWSQRRLAIPAPTTLTGNVGELWVTSAGANLTTASDGTSPYTYAITKGLLPPGLAFNAATSAITGTPNAGSSGTYTITVTATDSTVGTPLTGSVTFTLTIGGGVYLTHTAPATVTNGTATATVTTETPTTGVSPYTYTITAADTTAIAGLSIANTGVVSASNAVNAGTYNVLVSATDSTSPTPLQGADYWTLGVKLGVTHGAVTNAANGVASTLTALTTTGLTGSVSYALDAGTTALGYVSIDGSGNVKVSTSCTTGGPYTVTVTATDSSHPANATAAPTSTTTFTFSVM